MYNTIEITWGGNAKPRINQIIADFVAKRIKDCSSGWDRFVSMGILKSNFLVAGIIYHNYCPISRVIELSGASDCKSWLSRSVLKEIYSYPWNQLCCQAVIHRIPDEDYPQHRMLTSLGGIRYRIPRLRGRNAAENIYVITHEAWMHNKINRQSSVHKSL
ncbi:hypothetical protein Q7M76_05095 [Candidatus Liberibacter asiaticus]|uniref:Uncharacterized protein n=2 Tax=Liberibacter asiaticus TaxID=34021 RepID=C6XGV3_LIBAP|nr:hypothetical protein [Candidatus Liberibacter asiaticus]ACT57606.1 hypothetical protein CLIBASIA_05175 [Candidatus Liberibacter asiaticus str. psy62]AGH17372.1 hypothetical protein WSI_05030 [Candidatus Liberibacter asiaticus str. gxpsy]ALK07652.1 hypothetical protein CD16_05075 [Candidatus Liberibacter asiaticus]ASK53144.1 hypothetical protein B2I23_05140 [Candidatus Liberibacter asiaticus]AWL14465.1 hypothetical protein DIC79_05165 [Candidatus Liberibacter asiaticus]